MQIQRQANQISEVTRQEIIDLTNLGFRDSGTYEDVRIFWSGRLSEPDFLSRLYDLSSMNSTDSRFKDAQGDIWQHRENNYDWDDDWVFYDGRFNIKTGTDDNFLRFLCEMFHPAVRDEKKNWKRLIELINDLLRIDGYELYEKSHISSRSVYAWKRANQSVIVEAPVIKSVDYTYIVDLSGRATRSPHLLFLM